MRRASLVTALLLSVATAPPSQEAVQFQDRNLTLAEKLYADGKVAEATAAVQRALERDDRSLGALRMLAKLATETGDQDLAVHALHRWTEIAGSHEPAIPVRDKKVAAEELRALDSEARSWSKIQRGFVRDLLDLGKEYKRRKDALSGLDIHNHVLQIEPQHRGAMAKIREIRRTGGSEVAIEDVFGGADPSFGKSPEQIRKEDSKHATWERAWEKQTANYSYRSNAGFLTVETAAIAMEQVNRFYRTFFRYKEDGGRTPKIEVRIFASRDDYLSLGTSPAEWSGGQFTGSAVETYVGGVTGQDSIREMYRTLFHEAAHQFVSLTGGSVPGWLNEAYASFFEGCVILSNGGVKWNQVPPDRLFPLAERLERGWMATPNIGLSGAAGEWATPEVAPTFRMLIAADYEWGPPWYAPTWGVVYFLYNYRHEDGRPVYREALHAYYNSFSRGAPEDPVAHFEEVVLGASELSPVTSIDELDQIWRKWILALRDRHIGLTKGGNELERFGDEAAIRGDHEAALEFYEEALENHPDDTGLLEKTAVLLEEQKQKAPAAAMYKRLKSELERRGKAKSSFYDAVRLKVYRLDPVARQYHALKTKLAEQGLQLARSYEERELPTMALEIARRMSASFSIPEALEYYGEVARRTGKSLARWRLAYDGESLAGWSGATDTFQAYGDTIRAHVDQPIDQPIDEDAIVTNELICDVTFDADYSLEAEIQIEAPNAKGPQGSWAGVFFGRKGTAILNAVLLHPKGFLDISTNRGGVWKPLDHRSATVGHEWRKLRIDVTGTTLDVYLDGRYVRALEFSSAEAVHGAFGLIAGTGHSRFRNVRILARDDFDPAASIEREIAMGQIAENAALRQEGNFTGIYPPKLDVYLWIQGEAVELEKLRGKPVVLAFWSPAQDRVIPTAKYLAHLAERGSSRGIKTIVVCDGGTKQTELRAFLEAQPIPGALVGIDALNLTFKAYYITEGHHGIPRFLLLDSQGKVVFEGDPGLKAKIGWQPGTETYVDAAFQKLIDATPAGETGDKQ